MILTLPRDILFLIFFHLLAYGMGKKILKWTGADWPEGGLTSVFASGLGLAFFSFAIFAMGFCRGFYAWAFAALFLLVFAVSFPEIRQLFAGLRENLSDFRDNFEDRWDILWAVLIAAAALANLVFCYAPPHQGREIWYDLTLPKWFLQNHRILDIPDQSVSYYPLQIQMLYVPALALCGDLAARLVHYSLGLLSLGLIFFLTRRWFEKKAALLASVLFYLAPMVTSFSGAANIDLGTLFYGTLALGCAALWALEGSRSRLFLGAFFAGVAAGTKVTGIAVPLAFVTFMAGWALFVAREPKGVFARQLAAAAAFIFLGVCPWIFRNYIFTGNPAMPYSVSALGWQGHEGVQIEMNELARVKSGLTWQDYARGYHNLFYGEFIYGTGPLLLAFLTPIFLLPEYKRKVWVLSALAGFQFLFLHFLLPYPHRFYETRYYAASLGLTAVLAGWGGEILMRGSYARFIRILTAAALLVPCLAFNFLMAAKRLPVFFGRVSREDFLVQKLPNYPLIQFANKTVPPDSRILVLTGGDTHLYYWDARLVNPALGLLRLREAQNVLPELEKQGVTHILFFKSIYTWDEGEKVWRHRALRELDLSWDMDVLRGKFLRELYNHEDIILYRILYPEELYKG